MRIKTLTLDNFGPFWKYRVPFVEEESVCLLLTGKNNEGKSNIILALKLIASACCSVGRRKSQVLIDGEERFRLPQQDVEGLNIGRILHNYSGDIARIQAEFLGGFSVTVYLDERTDSIYADYFGRIPEDRDRIIGFVPPLGPLAETEDWLSLPHVKRSISTSLAPRHLRNHLAQILTKSEYEMVQKIISSSWEKIKLLEYKYNSADNTLSCFFREGLIDRELAWAGQGLQVWFQIITHLVRLRNTSLLVLDEPEVNLHAEKQNDLMRILKEHYDGSIIVATHSVELMNNVNVSHIIHVQKSQRQPSVKVATDRDSLDIIRSQIGSNFNLVASQFEEFDIIVFTEDVDDFTIIQSLAKSFGFTKKAFNIPLHGFSEYPKADSYREAYRLLIGGEIEYSMLLDRDYYPEQYLLAVVQEMQKKKIPVLFTPGKEIENVFLSSDVLDRIILSGHRDAFRDYWDRVFEIERLDCFGSYQTLHTKFLDPRPDPKTITTKYTPVFEKCWGDKEERYKIIGGKKALRHLRKFYRDNMGKNLTLQELLRATAACRSDDLVQLIGQLFGEISIKEQTLHY